MSDITRGHLTFCIGLPRAGKTTYCQNWVKYPEISAQIRRLYDNGLPATVIDSTEPFVQRPRVWVCGDHFRLAVCGQVYQSLSESYVFATMDAAVRALLDTGHDVIVDETGTTEATIKRYLRLDIDASPVWFDTTLETCLQRAKDTNRPYLFDPIKRIHRQLQVLRAGWPNNMKKWREEVRARMTMDKM